MKIDTIVSYVEFFENSSFLSPIIIYSSSLIIRNLVKVNHDWCGFPSIFIYQDFPPVNLCSTAILIIEDWEPKWHNFWMHKRSFRYHLKISAVGMRSGVGAIQRQETLVAAAGWKNQVRPGGSPGGWGSLAVQPRPFGSRLPVFSSEIDAP